jgi:excisionase family DNA binding protein
MESEKLLSRAEAAALLGLSPWTIRRYEKQGKLHSIKLSPITVRIRQSEVEALIEKGAQ